MSKKTAIKTSMSEMSENEKKSDTVKRVKISQWTTRQFYRHPIEKDNQNDIKEQKKKNLL